MPSFFRKYNILPFYFLQNFYKKLIVSAIAAMSRERAIGREGDIPWNMPADMKYFRETTTGHCVIMGRKSFDALKKPLAHRTNIVITRQEGLEFPGCTVVHNIEEAIAFARDSGESEAFVIGGGEIFSQAIPWIDRLYLTEIDCSVPDGDAFFPELDPAEWRTASSVFRASDEKNPFNCVFQVLEKTRFNRH